MCITNTFQITPYIKSLLSHLTCIYCKVANHHRQLYITWYKIYCNSIAIFTTAHCIGHEIDSIYMFVTAEKLRFLKINYKNPDNLSHTYRPFRVINCPYDIHVYYLFCFWVRMMAYTYYVKRTHVTAAIHHIIMDFYLVKCLSQGSNHFIFFYDTLKLD